MFMTTSYSIISTFQDVTENGTSTSKIFFVNLDDIKFIYDTKIYENQHIIWLNIA